MNDRARTVSKIKKLLALSASPHAAEAAVALAKARELMDLYDVDALDVAAADVSEHTAHYASAPGTPVLWLHALATVVGQAFGTEPLWTRWAGFSFVGVGPSAELSVYTYTVLRRRLAKARAAYYERLRGKRYNRVRKADDFALGWVVAVAREVQRFAKPVPNEVGTFIARQMTVTSDLVVRDRGRDRDGTHRWRGHSEGSKVELQHGVGGTQSPLSLPS